MITITVNFDSTTTPPADAIIAHDVSDYVGVRQTISRALIDGRDCHIYISNPVLKYWCSDLQVYRDDRVRWQYVDVRRQFNDHFGFELPNELPLDAVTSLNILKLPRPAPTQQTAPIAWLLGSVLAPIWGYVTPFDGHAAALAAWIVSQKLNWLPDALRSLVAAQIDNWRKSDPAYAAFKADDLTASSKSIFMRWVFRRYPSSWLQQRDDKTLSLIDTSAYFDVARLVVQEHEQEVMSHWRIFFAQSPNPQEALNTALVQMSWVSRAEIQVLSTFIQQHPQLASAEIIDSLVTNIVHLPDAQPEISRLKRYVMRSTPPSTDANWVAEQWLDWATEHYLPYFTWVIQTKESRLQQMQFAEEFTDWFYSAYPSLIASESPALLTEQFTKIRSTVIQNPDALILWVIIDGLTWWQGQLFAQMSTDYGFFLREHSAAYSVLPTITNVAKRVLVSGVVQSHDQRQTIADLLRERIALLPAQYTEVGSLERIAHVIEQAAKPGVYAVLYNTLDTVNHSETGFTGEGNEVTLGCLKKVFAVLQHVRQICEFQGRELQIFIGSDHGGTLLPQNPPRPALPQTAQEEPDDIDSDAGSVSTAPERRTRVASIKDWRNQQLIGDTASQWYVLDPVLYSLDRLYIVPRGYGYVSRKPTGWTHGGLTPEEVIVPLMQLTTERRTILQLTVDFDGYLLPKTVSEVSIRITNPNSYPLTDIVVQFETAAPPMRLKSLKPSGYDTQHIVFAPAIVAGKEQIIRWRLTYSAFGQRQEQQGESALVIKRLQQTTEFDAMFED